MDEMLEESVCFKERIAGVDKLTGKNGPVMTTIDGTRGETTDPAMPIKSAGIP